MGDADSQAHCGSMVEELDTTISYCTYQIKRAGGAEVDPSALLSLADGEGGALLQVSCRKVQLPTLYEALSLLLLLLWTW